MQAPSARVFADFFAGIGLVRYAFERKGWVERYALDYSPLKYAIHLSHFGKGLYVVEDIHTIDIETIPAITLAHASFPCTDISVAGSRNGLAGRESSAFWGFVRVLNDLDGRRPPIILLENVEGFLTSTNGSDLEQALAALCSLGYAVDILLIDANHFVPQSRVRLFIVGTRCAAPQATLEQERILIQQTQARPLKIKHFIRTHPLLRWYLNDLPLLPKRTLQFDQIIDHGAEWWEPKRTEYLYEQMHSYHQARIRFLMAQESWFYGTAFRRMRQRDGQKRSTAEIRTDQIAGCLRTPKGGSARQIVFRVGYGQFHARLLNGLECARLMGAEAYTIDPSISFNDLLFGFGDAVCVPAVEWIIEHAIEPLLARSPMVQIEAAAL